ncbi:hypothetical protein HBB16_10510 [Pseudonocardia sp. MCCB 268]|nr:hypothetical protein [Pseudonocardia cytotoxica]
MLTAGRGRRANLEALPRRRIPLARGAVSGPTPASASCQAWHQVGLCSCTCRDGPGSSRSPATWRPRASCATSRSDETRGWATALLAPLSDKGPRLKIDLRNTCAFLAHNGQSDASASALGIHQHTYGTGWARSPRRSGRRDIDDPTVRAELRIAAAR